LNVKKLQKKYDKYIELKNNLIKLKEHAENEIKKIDEILKQDFIILEAYNKIRKNVFKEVIISTKLENKTYTDFEEFGLEYKDKIYIKVKTKDLEFNEEIKGARIIEKSMYTYITIYTENYDISIFL